MTAPASNPLRELIAPGRATPVPGASNALSARVIEDVGFSALYVTGAGVANTYLGVPDVGLVSLNELAEHVRGIADAVSIPLVVDADTGFGNALGVQRTFRMLEQAGASAIQLEDQVAPKRCGHFEGQSVISTEEMTQKIRAAVDVRRGDTLLIARTDAINAVGFEEAVERATAYREAGADVVFVEGPADRAQLESVPARLPGIPLVANLVEGGRTPLVPRAELAAMGYGMALFANVALQASLLGMQQALTRLRDTGDLDRTRDLVLPWDERQRLARKPEFDEAERRYAARR